MNYNHLIEFLLKFQARLTVNDQQRFHAYLGENIIERIGQDSSIQANLTLISSLWNREDLNQHDIQALINACKTLQCTDHAQSLKRKMIEFLEGKGFEFSLVCFLERMKKRKSHRGSASTGNLAPLLPIKSTRNPKRFSFITDIKGRTSIQSKPRKGWMKILTSRTLSLLVIVRSLILIGILFGGCFLILRLHMQNKHHNSTQIFNSTSTSTDLPCDCEQWCTDGKSFTGRICEDDAKCICNEY